jgi:hypothetical protein
VKRVNEKEQQDRLMITEVTIPLNETRSIGVTRMKHNSIHSLSDNSAYKNQSIIILFEISGFNSFSSFIYIIDNRIMSLHTCESRH